MPQIKKWDGFKPPGRPLPGEWDLTAVTKSNGDKRVVHVVIWDGDLLLFVKNKSKVTKEFTKRSAWGIPTETVRSDPAESPYEAAQRVVREEINLFGKEIVINSRPILITKTKENGVVHFLFEGSIEPYTEIPKEIRDTADEVTEAAFFNPDIVQIPDFDFKASDEDRMPFFIRANEKERVYASHLGFAAHSRYHR